MATKLNSPAWLKSITPKMIGPKKRKKATNVNPMSNMNGIPTAMEEDSFQASDAPFGGVIDNELKATKPIEEVMETEKPNNIVDSMYSKSIASGDIDTAKNLQSYKMPTSDQPGISGNTGAGANGTVEPLNRTARALDEGEAVFSNQDTKNIGEDFLGQLMKSSQEGQLTPDVMNKLRTTIGLPEEKRFYEGGIAGNEDPETLTNQPGIASVNPNQATNVSFNNTVDPVPPPSGTLTGPQPGIANVKPFQADASIKPPPVPTPPPSASDAARNLGLSGLSNIARGESPYFDTMANRLTQDQQLAGAASQGALRQSQAQRGLTGTEGVGGIESAQLNRDLSSQAAGLRGELAETSQSARERAMNQLASQGLAGQQLEEGMRKFDETQALAREKFNEAKRITASDERWAEFDTLAKTDLDAAAALYKEITGEDIDMSYLQTLRDKPIAFDDYTVIEKTYQDALQRGKETGDYTEAQEIYNQMKGNPDYADWMGAEPNWEALGDVYDDGCYDSLMGDIWDKIDTDAPIEQVTNDIWEALEISTGKTVEEMAEEQGISTTQVIQNEYDRIKAMGNQTEVGQYLKDFEIDNPDYFDTPKEAEMTKKAITTAAYGGALKTDAQGNLYLDPSSVVMPWDDPQTAHVYASEVSLSTADIAEDLDLDVNDPAVATELERRKGIVDLRKDYLHNDDEPIGFEDWYDILTDGTLNTPEKKQAELDKRKGKLPGAADLAPDTTIMTTKGEEKIIEDTNSPTGFSTASGVYVGKTDTGDAYEYDYTAYKNDNGGSINELDKNFMIEYAGRGDVTALKDVTSLITNGDYSILSGRKQGDSIYDSYADTIDTMLPRHFDINAVMNDSMKTWPIVGGIYKQTNGDVLKITFTGWLDKKWSTSDYAYVEYENLNEPGVIYHYSSGGFSGKGAASGEKWAK